LLDLVTNLAVVVDVFVAYYLFKNTFLTSFFTKIAFNRSTKIRRLNNQKQNFANKISLKFPVHVVRSISVNEYFSRRFECNRSLKENMATQCIL